MLSIFSLLSRFCFSVVVAIRRPSFAWKRYCGAAALWRSRQSLAALSDCQLADIGVTRDKVEREVCRPFWADQAPWEAADDHLHGEKYLPRRPLEAVQSFYHARGHRRLGH